MIRASATRHARSSWASGGDHVAIAAGEHDDQRPILAGCLLQRRSEPRHLVSIGQLRLVNRQHHAGVACHQPLGETAQYTGDRQRRIILALQLAGQMQLRADNTGKLGAKHRLGRTQPPRTRGGLKQLQRARDGLRQLRRQRR